MVKATCILGTFIIDGCKLEIIDSWAPAAIKKTFTRVKKLGVGDPEDGDPDMVLAKRILEAVLPPSGKIVEYKPPEIDQTVIY